MHHCEPPISATLHRAQIHNTSSCWKMSVMPVGFSHFVTSPQLPKQICLVSAIHLEESQLFGSQSGMIGIDKSWHIVSPSYPQYYYDIDIPNIFSLYTLTSSPLCFHDVPRNKNLDRAKNNRRLQRMPRSQLACHVMSFPMPLSWARNNRRPRWNKVDSWKSAMSY